jgi:hypothetical protein
MNQPTITEVAAAKPVLTASEQGEPTVEELAALIDPATAAPLEPYATDLAPEAPKPAEPATAATDPVESAADTAEADAAHDRAQKAAARAREGSRRYAETQAALREQRAQVHRAAHDADVLRRENAAARQREAGLKADPYKALKELGMTDADLAARAMRENTPEAVTQRLADQLAEERAARVALETRLANERAASHQAQAEATFTRVADDEASYPRLSQLATSAQLTVAKAALQQISRNGYDIGGLSDAQVAEACEAYLAPKRAAKVAAAPTRTAAPTTSAAKPSGRTLTNAQAQTRVVAPASWDSLSEEQQLAHIAASLPEPT